VNLRSKLLWVFLAGFFGPIDAAATCQPYKSDPAFLADLQRDDFHARVFQTAAQPPAPEERQRLRTIARERRLDHLAELALFEGLWRFATGAPLPHPAVRRAPFEWRLEATPSPVADPVRIELDADGDGRTDLVWETGKRPKSASYIYREGEYPFVVRIHDRSGKLHTQNGRLRIVSPAAFDERLKRTWTDLKDALRRGDYDAALECIHTRSRKRYSDIFAAIPDLPRKVDEALTEIREVAGSGAEGLFEMSRRRDNRTQSFQVRFEIDADAIWRLGSF
jgi:hypothetical protein